MDADPGSITLPESSTSPTTHYVIGPPRSGTTIVAYLLAGGSGVLSLSEPHLALEALPTWKLHRFYRRILREGGLRQVRPPFSADYGQYGRFLRAIATRSELTRLVIKETYRGGAIEPRWDNESFLASTLESGTPGALIIRDPYDTCASFIRLARWVTGLRGRLVRVRWPKLPWFADADAAVRWSADNWRRYAAWLRRIGASPFRYEDIVADVRKVLPRLCEACALPYEERMLDFGRARHAFGGLGDPGVMDSPPRALNSSSIGRGRELTARQGAIVREACAEDSAVLGYAD